MRTLQGVRASDHTSAKGAHNEALLRLFFSTDNDTGSFPIFKLELAF